MITFIPPDDNFKIGEEDPFKETQKTGWSAKRWEGGMEYTVDVSHPQREENNFQNMMFLLFVADSVHDFKAVMTVRKDTLYNKVLNLWLGLDEEKEIKQLTKSEHPWSAGDKWDILKQTTDKHGNFNTITLDYWYKKVRCIEGNINRNEELKVFLKLQV